MQLDLLGNNIEVNDYLITKIPYEDTKDYILNIHYAKRMPSITYAFGLYEKGVLVGVVCYGSPASQSLCKGIAGQEHRSDVLELNRLVLKNNKKNEASILVSASFKLLPKPKIIVSYADSEQNHLGTVYQATNFLYTGLSDKHKEWRMIGNNLHSKNVCKIYTLSERKSNPDKFIQIERPRKHRYLYFLGNKTQKKLYKKDLKYKLQEYPKNND